jgi:dihydroorotase
VSRLLIRNGRVVDPSQGLDDGMDLLLEDGVVAVLAERLDVPDGAEVVDAAGLVVTPGFIDLNARLGEPGDEQAETVRSGLEAAAAGGFTAVCSSPDTDPVNDSPAVTSLVLERAARVRNGARCYPLGAVSRGLAGEEMAEIGKMLEEGVRGLSSGDRGIRDAQLLRRVLEYARSFDLTVADHPIEPSLASDGTMHEGPVSTRIGVQGMPAAAEEVVVARDVLLAELTGGRLHLQHLSTAGSVAAVRSAKERGAQVSCEAAPHHFLLTDEDLAASTYDPRFKTMPPLRGAGDVEAVLHGIYDGTVDAIVSDHAPCRQDLKELDLAVAPAGAVGLETTVALAIDRLVHGRVIGILQLVRLLSTSPAELFGLPGGSLRPGSPADVTVLDLGHRSVITPDELVSKSRNTPFAGRKVRGAPVLTVVGGRIVWRRTNQR